MPNRDDRDLPIIIAGPIIRRATPEQIVLWLVTSQPLEATFELYCSDVRLDSRELSGTSDRIRIGRHALVYLLDYQPAEPLPTDIRLEYDLRVVTDHQERGLADLLPHLLYEGKSRPGFVLKARLDHLLHGSCRKPHYPGADGLLRVDELLQRTVVTPSDQPALLILTGDQVYADDVAGPMLSAVHQTILRLGLYHETLTGATVPDSETLYASELCYYRREALLPRTEANRKLRDRFFRGVRKPIFTAATARNHLITLAEVLAMYLLVWSPSLWSRIRLSCSDVAEPFRDLYRREQEQIEGFASELPRIQRMLAHLPVYMIFDDHDVTDDWNLTRGWEESAYGNPFSRRIIGNALIGYWLCQGWGNAPQRFDQAFLEGVRRCFARPGSAEQDALIDQLLAFNRWHYSLPTMPGLVVLDTRTRRWWSESSLAKPSGLMDWEALSDLQQELIGRPAVVMVSPAPVFGVKLIEIVQRVFTFFGYALTVDAENWMAHNGSAQVILNIFKHPKTPRHFVILSGDVHYSFAYDVTIRFRENSPRIWQVTCSGLKNEFPATLLRWFDRLNHWFFASRSPLNWFTKRRDMRVRARKPRGKAPRQLLNCSGVGRVKLDRDGVPVEISVLPTLGGEVQFEPQQHGRFRTPACAREPDRAGKFG